MSTVISSSAQAPGLTGSPSKQINLFRIDQDLPTDLIVGDAGRAALLRRGLEEHIEKYPTDTRPLHIDLNRIQMISLGAAEELFVRFLDGLRARERTRHLVVVFSTYNSEVRRTVHSALREGRHAAYVVRSSPLSEAMTAELIGEITPLQIDTIERLRRPEQGLTARDLGESLGGLGASAATNRLTDLHSKGLVVRIAQLGRSGDRFLYPFSKAALDSTELH